MKIFLKNNEHLELKYYGVDEITGYDIYISEGVLSTKFQINSEIKSGSWKDMEIRKNLDKYLLENFPLDFIFNLKKDQFGDLISVPSAEEMFDVHQESIYSDLFNIKHQTKLTIDNKLGKIYWLKNHFNNITGMWSSICGGGNADMQVMTNFENVRCRFLL